MLKVAGISSGYQGVRVLQDVSFEVPAGEIVCLLGRNGAGKTTCLKTLMGLIKPSAGQILLNGEDISGLPADRYRGAALAIFPREGGYFLN